MTCDNWKNKAVFRVSFMLASSAATDFRAAYPERACHPEKTKRILGSVRNPCLIQVAGCCQGVFFNCCTKVIMSGVNGNVIMSGWRDDNPDDERREAARGYTKSI